MTKHIEFTETSHIRRVTVDPFGNILEVTNMFNMFGEDTEDPGIATACVVQTSNGQWHSLPTDDVPIYTVH